MDSDRLERVRTKMRQEKLDVLVCRLPENILLLSGHWPLIGWSYLVFPAEGSPICIVPDCDRREAEAELWEADCISFPFGTLAAGNPFDDIIRILKQLASGKNWKRIGVEYSFDSMAPAWNTAETALPSRLTENVLTEVFGHENLVDATTFILGQRSCKTAGEVEKLRIVNEISVFGLETFHELVAPGISGVELAAEVERAVMLRGSGYKNAGRVRAFAQIAAGPEDTGAGYRPMEISSTRELLPGDIVLLELAVVADGFWSDRTRVRIAGKADSRQRDIFNLVRVAQEAAIAKAGPGITAGMVDEAARSIIRAAGFDREFLHVTGHGIGLRYHEPTPLICPGGDLLLEPGMVHTVEPGIYFPGFGGMRIEDDVLITGNGCEILGPYKKELE